MQRPQDDEYAPYYALYISKVEGDDVDSTLDQQLVQTIELLNDLGEGRAGHRYAPDKWSVKQVVGHMIDVERIFTTRCLAFARGHQAPWPDMDQDEYMRLANFDRRSLADLAQELAAVRASSLALFRSLEEADWGRRGTASGNEFTARSIPWIIAGHERHHVGVLRERYR